MPNFITPDRLSKLIADVHENRSSGLMTANPLPLALIDVRKAPARATSGFAISGSVYRKPFDAENWFQEFRERTVIVYCVHGHEVSQAVCGFLADEGLDCRYLEGGFEGWCASGGSVSVIGE